MIQQKPIFHIFEKIQHGRHYGDNYQYARVRIYGADLFHFLHDAYL